MLTIQNSKSFRHFSRHLFLVNRIRNERNKSRDELYAHIEKMRKSIIRMNLTYSDADRLKQKMNKLIDLERKYAKFFKPEDSETRGLKDKINSLEKELKDEKEEKSRVMSENEEKIKSMAEALNNVKNQMKHLQLEKAKRQQRLNVLEKKINGKVDIHGYYHS